ncbi:MAG: undecaprenyldiphospho-muramoylpentapeptide beta-N-acetylglucosaminyltransferase [Bacteroidetes bacterium]|nr:undecaprenyldiphospho-muramoylpentapeptide beta-N-acetylglucosaminyltransferase [Bacteroidota bacterium]MBL6943322.1 undecaprenyldiphospho-muramoylpentapeptide beta-N-acetylglucosaminyltransferase [Bacteroidales bacterium]
MPETIKILISGGGTGGHIFPAIAIANAIKEKLTDVDIHFVGALGRMEMDKVPMAGFPITGLWISGLQRKLTTKNLLFPIKVILSIFKSYRIIKKFNPNVVIGTGGYASGPLLYAASQKKIPTFIHEQNAFPGITNKMLGKSVNKVCVSYPNMEKYFPKEKIIITGNPIRKEILNLSPTKKESLDFFKLGHVKQTLLVIGGSQGAKQINIAVAENLNKLLSLNLQIIWQTGNTSKDIAQKAANGNKHVVVTEFIQEMDMAYAASDFIISRAGAIAIAEIIAAKKPSIFIPLPTAAEDHQTKNALSLVNGNAALMISENDAVCSLTSVVRSLVENTGLQKTIINNLGAFSYPDAAENIANVVLKMANKK